MHIALLGASGRTGSRVRDLARNDSSISGIEIVDTRSDEPVAPFDILIDFSRKESLPANLSLALRYNKPIVIGVTGYDDSDRERIRDASQTIPVFFSPNFSIGMACICQAARVLASQVTDPEFHIEEIHRTEKKDSPSGSALLLRQSLLSSRSEAVVSIRSLRIEETPGTHILSYRSEKEEIVISHKALSPDLFAEGALRAARFLKEMKKPGIYSMNDLLGFSSGTVDPSVSWKRD